MVTSHTLDLTSDMAPFLPLPSFEGFSYYRTSVLRRELTKERQDPMPGPSLSLSFFVAGRCAVKCAMEEIFLWVSYDLARFPEPVRAEGLRGLQQNMAEQHTPGIHVRCTDQETCYTKVFFNLDFLLIKFTTLSAVVAVVATRLGPTHSNERS